MRVLFSDRIIDLGHFAECSARATLAVTRRRYHNSIGICKNNSTFYGRTRLGHSPEVTFLFKLCETIHFYFFLRKSSRNTICPCFGWFWAGSVLPTAMLEGRFWCFVGVLQGTRKLNRALENQSKRYNNKPRSCPRIIFELFFEF